MTIRCLSPDADLSAPAGGDQEEAAELLEDFLEHKSLVEVYDTVLIPALAFAETQLAAR